MMRTRWQQFQGEDGRIVEAQVFTPASDTGDVILFCPGFPGAGATLFEQRHVATLVHEGYAVIVIRHAGTRLDTVHAPMMINNGHRLHLARRSGQTLLGGAPATMDTWMMEPYVVLRQLVETYRGIHVIGNSFGALSAMWSLTEDDAPLGHIKTLVLLAGAQGMHDGSPFDIMRIWRPEFIAMPRVTEKVTLEPPEQVAATLAYAYRELPARVKTLPEHITLKYLVVKNDEILRVEDTENFRAAIGGRGDIVIDEIDRAHPVHGLMAHDMPDYPTEYILDLIQGDEPHGLADIRGWNN